MKCFVYAVVVLYNPNCLQIKNILHKYSLMFQHVILIDNTDCSNKSYKIDGDNVKYVSMQGNAGIARAQNHGIALSFEMGANFVMLLDQDSDIEILTVQRLVCEYERLVGLGLQVAAVGPLYVDKNVNRCANKVIESNNNVFISCCTQNSGTITSDVMISSGMLISRMSIEKIGLMSEFLFIDLVDIEWCLRAKYFGFCCYIVTDAIMEHCIGYDNVKTVMGNRIGIHSPFRFYYQVRNFVIMSMQSWLSRAWKKYFSLHRIFFHILKMTIYHPSHLRIFFFGLKGLVHGLRFGFKYKKGLPVKYL